jgi:hypothetical protein
LSDRAGEAPACDAAPPQQEAVEGEVMTNRPRIIVWAALAAVIAGLSGCGLAAAPCRVASAGLKIVPVVGHVAAAPTDACAGVIDP